MNPVENAVNSVDAVHLGISQLGSTTTTDNGNLVDDNGSEITDDKFNDGSICINCIKDYILKICRMGLNVFKRQGARSLLC